MLRIVTMIQLSRLKKGSYLLHRGEPYEVIDMGIVVTGTHSHSKTKATVKGVFSGTTEILIKSHHETVEELDIIRKKATVISISGESIQVMDSVSFETKDGVAEYPNDISEGDEITYIDFNNQVKILGKR